MTDFDPIRNRIAYWRAQKIVLARKAAQAQTPSQKSAVTPSPVIQRVTTAK